MRSGLVAVLVLGLLALTSCGRDERRSDESLLGERTSSPSAEATRAAAPRRRDRPARTPARLLRDRAAAVLAGDREAFLAPVRGAGFRAEQSRLFDNLQRLPVADLAYRRDGAAVVRDLRLEGADVAPMRSAAGFRIVTRRGRPVIVRGTPATDPWDLAVVDVVRTRGALVVHDAASAGAAAAVARAVDVGRTPVERMLGRGFDGRSVVYLFSTPEVLASYDAVEGASGDVLGALTFPARDGSGSVAGQRLALLPAGAALQGRDLERLVRHELVHAVLPDSSRAPLWLVEGLAEYVGQTAVPRAEQRIARSALDRARIGLTSMPPSAGFHGSDGPGNYSIAWMAAEQVADDGGFGALLGLLEDLSAPGVVRDGPEVDRALRARVGYGQPGLARRTGDRIVRLFGR